MSEEHDCSKCGKEDCEIRDLLDECLNKDFDQHLIKIEVSVLVSTTETAKLQEDAKNFLAQQMVSLGATLADGMVDCLDIVDYNAFPIKVDFDAGKLSNESAFQLVRKIKHND
jgi:hypothetical protein